MSYILLTSKNAVGASRRYNELGSTDEVATAILNDYEGYLNERESSGECGDDDENNQEYTMDMLFEYLDTKLTELACLVREEHDPNLWIPYPKHWIKESCIFMYARHQHNSKKETNGASNGTCNGVRHQEPVYSSVMEID